VRALLPLVPFLVVGLAVTSWAEDPPIPADTTVQKSESGLQWSVLAPGGGGESPRMGDKVRVHYTGWTTDGKVFDSSRQRGQPAEFVLGEVVQGWNEGLQRMTKGERVKLTIPPGLAYGAEGRPPVIPPNATLIFDVELLDFVAMPRFHPAVPERQTTTASGLKSEVLTEGAGDPPKANEAFEIKFAYWTTDGKLLDASERQGTLKATSAQMSLGVLKEAPLLLAPGARWRFEVPPALGFGDRSPSPELPPGSTTVWEIEMVRIIKPLPEPAFQSLDPAKTVTKPSGLKIQVIEEGTGPSPVAGAQVSAHYAGWLADGTPFDSSYQRGEPMVFPLGRVIPGWSEGLLLMKEGGTYLLEIPGAIAYGPMGKPPKIPPNATLVFRIQLVKAAN
jgi:FKBP-type peptidyl-prolyl cis-trans isomerase